MVGRKRVRKRAKVSKTVPNIQNQNHGRLEVGQWASHLIGNIMGIENPQNVVRIRTVDTIYEPGRRYYEQVDITTFGDIDTMVIPGQDYPADVTLEIFAEVFPYYAPGRRRWYRPNELGQFPFPETFLGGIQFGPNAQARIINMEVEYQGGTFGGPMVELVHLTAIVEGQVQAHRPPNRVYNDDVYRIMGHGGPDYRAYTPAFVKQTTPEYLKAEKTFLSLLSETNRKRYQEEKKIFITGSKGDRFAIHGFGISNNIFWVDEDDRNLGRYCLHATQMSSVVYPVPDHLILQMLLLQTDEKAFFDTAISSGPWPKWYKREAKSTAWYGVGRLLRQILIQYHNQVVVADETDLELDTEYTVEPNTDYTA